MPSASPLVAPEVKRRRIVTCLPHRPVTPSRLPCRRLTKAGPVATQLLLPYFSSTSKPALHESDPPLSVRMRSDWENHGVRTRSRPRSAVIIAPRDKFSSCVLSICSQTTARQGSPVAQCRSAPDLGEPPARRNPYPSVTRTRFSAAA
jgi:hypothetical protein